MNIQPKHIEFLLLLSKTGFLTNKHIEMLGFASLKTTNHNLANTLLTGGYIGRVMVSTGFGFGRKVMYFLVKKGAELLEEIYGYSLETLTFSNLKGGIYTKKNGEEVSVIRADFQHKEAYITAFLAFQKYLNSTNNYELTDYKHYYQRGSNKATTLTIGGKNFRPDGIWFAESIEANQPKYVYVVEIHRHSDRKHIIRQLRQQIEALKEKGVQKRFGFEHPYLILSIFTDKNLQSMQSVLEDLKRSEDWEIIEKFCFFARLDDLVNDFYKGLGYFGGINKPIPKNI